MKKALIVIAVVVALSGASLLAYSYWFSTSPHESSDELEDSINYGPPTQQEVEETNKFKEDQASEEDSFEPEDSPNAQEPREVSATLTRVSVDSDLVTVAGYADSSKNGECRLELRSSAETKEYTNPTETNPTNPDVVNCSNFRVPRRELSASDKWVAQIFYSADGLRGTTQTWEFEL